MVDQQEIVLPEQRTRELGELAHGVVEQLKNLLYEQNIVFIEIGRHLKQIRDEKLYQTLDYDTFQQFLADPDVCLKVGTAYSYIRIYELFILKLGFSHEDISGIPYRKLHLLCGEVADATKEEAEDWLNKARSMGGHDFEIELTESKENKGRPDILIHPHLRRCLTCGLWRHDRDEKLWCKGGHDG